MRDSILWSALKACFVTLFGMVGLCLGLIPVILIFSGVTHNGENAPAAEYAIEILPNAHGKRKALSTDEPVILSIPIDGVIGLNQTTQHHIRKMLVESREGVLGERVKGILLTFETPGGTVIDADGIYRALKEYKELYNVPVYAYVDGMCASGGVYIASAADKIYASKASIIGSVGVITPSYLNYAALLEKVGVSALTLYAGKGKDDLNPLRTWRTGEQVPLQNIIDLFYDQFVDVVCTNRPQINREKLVQDYGANVFMAEKAMENGYLDGMGLSRNQALQLLLDHLQIEGTHYSVVQMTNNSWFNALFNRESPFFTGTVKHELKMGLGMDEGLQGKFLYLYTGAQ